MKKIVSYILTGLLFAVGGCNAVEPKINLPGPQLNLLNLIRFVDYGQSVLRPDSLALDSVAQYVSEHQDLEAILTGPDDYTFFAPSNKVFTDLFNNPASPFSIFDGAHQINRRLANKLFRYHLVAGKKRAETLVPGEKLPSILIDNQISTSDAPQEITVISRDTLRGSIRFPNRYLSSANNPSTNGIIHILASGLLVPPSLGETIFRLAGTVGFPILLDDNFSIYARLVEIADTDFEEDPDPNVLNVRIDNLLSLLTANIEPWMERARRRGASIPADVKAGLTVFVIVDRTVQTELVGGEKSFLARTPSEARSLLLNHIVLGRYTVDQLVDGADIYSLIGGFQGVGSSGIPPLTVERSATADPSNDNNPFGIFIKTKGGSGGGYISRPINTLNGIVYVVSADIPTR